MRQIKLWVAAIAVLLCSLTANAHDIEVNGIYYNVISETDLMVAVTYRGSGYESYPNEYVGEVTIPEAVTYNDKTYRVTSIGNSTFFDCSDLISITLPEGLTSIGGAAFYDCTGLTSIIIPESSQLISIGANAFSGCSNLTSISIPESVTSIGEDAFWCCRNLTTMTIPKNSKLTSIGNYTFYSCERLTSITIPEYVTSIGENAFQYCRSLESITIPESVTDIGNWAFYDCRSLTSINIPKNVTSIGEKVFQDCYSLTSINIPENVTSIGRYAFNNCSKLIFITLPESVISIGENAFSFCSSLTSITFPDGVSEIGKYAFQYCSSLKFITIPESVTKIEDGAFENCSSLISITFSDESKLTSIGNWAFRYCSNLISITLPESVTLIESGAFLSCSSLTSITCHAVTPPTIGSSETFLNVNRSIPVYVPAGSVETYKSSEYWSEFTNIRSIGLNVASGICGDDLTWKLTEEYELVIEGTGAMYDYNINEKDVPWYEYREFIKEVTMEEGITSIGNDAFAECSSLTSISIPEGVTSIGAYAFLRCSSLEIIYIPASLTLIDDKAFNLCTNLRKFLIDDNNTTYTSYRTNNSLVVKSTNTLQVGTTSGEIPNGVTSIGDFAFASRNITDSHISIPEGVVSIGNFAFCYCPISSIHLPKSLKKCEQWAFEYTTGGDKSNISKVYIDDLVAWLDIDFQSEGSNPLCNGASLYLNDRLLEPLLIPEGVTSIRYLAFDGWGGEEIVLPASVTEIDYGAFSCSNLTSITCKAGTPPAIHESTFSSVDKSIPVYVLAGSVNAYKAAEYWNEFTNIQPLINNIDSGVCGDNLTWRLTEEGELIIEGIGEMTASPWLGKHENKIKKVTIKEGVTSISNAAFVHCTILEAVTIPSTVINISDDNVFNFCFNLYSITIDENNPVYTNGDDCSNYIIEKSSGLLLYGCRDIKLPSIVKTIGWNAFIGRHNLTSINIPKDVVFEGERNPYNPFSWCKNIREIIIEEGHPNYYVDGNVVIARKWESEALGDDYKDYKNVLITAFNDATTIPAYVECILRYAFDKFSGMSSLTCLAKTPPMPQWFLTEEDSGSSINNYNDLILYIPKGTKEAYMESLLGWGNYDDRGFKDYVEIENIIDILDSQESFSQLEDELFDNITYTRVFNNTNWQALYVPFEIPMAEEFLTDFEVADLNNVRQYDRDDDGVKDETVIEAFKVTSGTLKANYPYLIRAKEAGEKTIVVTDATLYAAEENSIDCSSIHEKFTFTGTYSRLSSDELPQGEGYYALSDGIWQPVAEGASLGAFRFYLKVDSRDGMNASQSNAIRMRIIGEGEEGDDTTSIENMKPTANSQQPTAVYDLQGRRVENPTKGVYIVNGQKVVL